MVSLTLKNVQNVGLKCVSKKKRAHLTVAVSAVILSYI